MAYQAIGIGSSANDGTGDDLRTAGDKVNDNFVEIYTLLGTGTALSSGISATASVVTLTAPLIATSLNPASANGAALGSASAEWSDLYLSDSSVIYLGADQDVTLTHVHDTGILINSTRQLQFGDSGTYIHQSADGVLDLVSDTELELNATTIDINGNVEISGTTAQVGVATFTARPVFNGGITIGDGDQIGSASDADAITISSGGVVTFSQAPVFSAGATLTGSLGISTSLNPDASDGATLGTTALEWSDLYLADGAQILFGDDQEVTLTHVHDTGLLLNSTMQLQFNDASQYINAPSNTILDINATDEIELNATLVDVNANLDVSGTYQGGGTMTTGGNIVIPNAGNIGSASDLDAIAIASDGVVTMNQIPVFSAGINVSGGSIAGTLSTAAQGNITSLGTLTTLTIDGDLDVGDDIKLTSDASVIAFGANGDVTLTHVHDTGILLNSTMQLQFNDASQNINAPSATVLDINATDEIELNATLVDVNANLDVSGTYTGAGTMTTGGNIVIPNAGNIGSASDTDAISISSGGVVTFSQTPIFSGDLQVEDDLVLDSDGAVLSFGEDNEVTLTHVHDTGILLNSTMAIQFNDASQFINAPSNAILDINATDEIELNATLVDVNANLDVSGTYTGAGTMTTGGNIVIPDAGTIGSASDTDAMAIGSDGDVTLTQDLELQHDGAILSFGANDEVTLTHVHDTGLLLNSTMQLQFNDASQFINAPSATVLDINATDEIELNATLVDVNANLDVSGTYQGGGTMTTGGGIVIPDAGNIGSASDTDAIAIGSDGDVTLTQDLELQHDGAILSFGANDEVTLTHVHDTGILLNSTMAIQFNDASQFINAPSNAILDINATDEIELNATLVDVNANLDVSGTYTGAGTMTTGGNIVIPDAGTIGSASDTNAIAIGSDGDVTLTQDLELQHDGAILSFGADDDVTVTHVHDTGLILNAAMVMQFRDSAINIGSPADGDLDINADDEIELNSTLIDINGAVDISGATTVGGILKTDDSTEATSTTDGSLQTDGGLSVVKDIVAGDDIKLLSDAAVMHFGANSEITLTHVHDVGLTLTHVTAGDNLPVVLQLKSEEDAVVANEVIASLEFAAGDSDGTDGATVAAGIHAIAEGTFSASANATKLVFTTGVSETAASSATAKATLSSIGDFTVAGDLVIKDGGLIGSGSDLDAMSISAAGVVNFSARPTFAASLTIQDGGSIGSASDLNALTISSGGVVAVTATTASSAANNGALTVGGGAGIAADLTVGDDIRLLSDAAVLSFGADADVTLTHVHDTGILLNSTMAIQFNDASQFINAPSNAILDINATDEIELNATLVDVNANLDVSGTYTGGGTMTTGGNIVIPDDGNIGSVSDTDAIVIDASGNVTIKQNLTVSGTQTYADTVTMQAENAVVFEGATADAHETTLTIIDPTADRTQRLLNQSGYIPLLAAVTTTAISSTPEELNILDGATVVVGEINALDLGSTAVGTAIASKAVILDSNKDYTGIRNLTISGEIDAATGDFSGAVDVAGATTTAALTASGILKTDDTTEATSTTDGSLQTDGGLSVAKDIVAGDDIKLLSDAAVAAFGADGDVTLTHVADTGLLLNAAMVVQFRDSAINIGSPADGDLDINADDEIELNSTLIDINGAVDISGATTVGGILKTDDATEATSTTDGSLQTDGGLSVVKDAVFGDDVKLLSDASVVAFGANSEITLTHVHDAGLTVTNTINGTDNRPVILQLKSEEDAIVQDDVIASIELAAGDSDGTDGATVAAGIHAIAEGTFSASANATKLVFTTGVSETAASSATAKMTLSSAGLLTIADDFIIKDGGTIGSASDVDAIAIGSDGDVTLTQDLELQHDGAILSFGANDEVTLTHVHNDGLLLNADMQLQFRDSAINIRSDADGDLDINADDEIELNSTLVDVNANLDVSGTYTGGGTMTTGGNIVIPDAGSIGSASDTNALTISSGGVVAVTATTASSAANNGALTVAGGAGIAADLTVGDDVRLLSDAAVLSFGADSDVTFTHVADTGLLLNGTSVIQFNDASQNIGAPSNAILDINATDEIELNATLLDVNANINASGTYTGAGTMTTGGNIVIPDAGTIGSASDTDAIAIGSDGDVTLTQDLELQHDGAILSFGANDDVTVTHVHNTGLLLNAAMVMQFRDSAINIGSPADGDLDINADDEIELNSTLIDINGAVDISGATTVGGILKTDDATEATSTTDGSLQTDGGLSVVKDAVFGDDVKLLSDAAVISFGANSEITATHVHNVGLTLTHTATGDNTPMVLQLKSEEDAIVANEVIGSLEFAAGDSDGTDGATVAAGIHAIAEGTFAADANATKLVFTTGVSETAASSATAKMTLSSAGLLTIADDLVIKDGGTIGVASDADAITIASNGQVTLTQTLIGTALDISGDVDIDGTLEADAITVNGTTLAETISDTVGAMVGSNTETGISVTYQDGDNTIDFALAAAQTTITSLLATDIKIGEDDQTKIDFETADEIHFYANNANEMIVQANVVAPGADDGTALGDANQRWSDLFLASGAVVNFDNGDVTATHSSNTLTIAGGTLATAALTTSTIVASGIIKTDDSTEATSTTDGSLQTDGGLSVVKDAVFGDDVKLLSDAAVISFGANSEITATHVHNVGLTLTHTATGDNTPMVLQLKSEEDAIVANEIIASIEFAAGDSDGTDGATVAAGIHAIAEGTFSASANATKLVFTTGVSETAASSATAKMTLSSAGLLTIADDFVIKDGGTIGVASDADSMTIASNGVVTFSQIPVLPANSIDSDYYVDGSIDTAHIADNQITLAKMAGIARGKIIVGDASGDPSVLAPGSNGQVLASDGTDLSFVDISVSALAADNLTAGDAAINLTTSSGNITIDAAANDSDIILKGTDGGADTTFLTIDGSAAGEATFNAGIVIADAGVIGSASDKDAIAIGSDGDVTLTQDLELQHDGAILSFGADDDVTITHVHDTGILLNSTMAIQFNDASQYINAPSNAILDINATDEIELNATLLDVNANINASGTYTGAGTMTTGGNIVIPDAGNIGSASDTDAIAIGSDGDVTLTQDLELQHDGAILSFGANDDVTLTHVHNTGLILNAAMVMQFRDSAINIGSPADGDLDINADDEIELNSTLIDINGNLDVSGTGVIAGAVTTAALTASGIIKTDDTTAATSVTDGSLQTDGGLSVTLDAVIGDDIIMISDAAQIAFGVNSEITLAHVHNVGLTLTHATAGDNLPVVLQLKSEEDIIVANEVIASLEFAAGDSDGTDGATVAAGIHAIAEDTFSASANKTKLVFTTGVSETAASSATAKATLSSIGDFTVAGDLIIKDGGTIGSASDLDAIAIASNGVVTFSQIPVMPANSIDSDEYIDGSIDRAHLSADIIDGTKIADDAIDSEHYTDGSIDTAHIADDQVTQAKMANDSVGSAEMKTLSTLLIKNSGGTTLKTLHGAGA